MSSKQLATAALVLAAAAAAAACSGSASLPDVQTDTGYQGTWERGNERVQSRLSIVRLADGSYRFRHTKTSEDEGDVVKCDWNGACTEYVDGEAVSRFKLDVGVDAATGRLRVECTGHVDKPTATDIHWIDELVVKKKGLQLWSYTVLDNNGEYEFGKGPLRKLKKVSDYVMDPPEGWTPPRG